MMSEKVSNFLKEAKKYRKAEHEAGNKANSYEITAITNFLKENNLTDVVRHKKTGRKGELFIRLDSYRGYMVEFYPLKKNGETSQHKSEECTEWTACTGYERCLNNLVKQYEPCERSKVLTYKGFNIVESQSGVTVYLDDTEERKDRTFPFDSLEKAKEWINTNGKYYLHDKEGESKER